MVWGFGCESSNSDDVADDATVEAPTNSIVTGTNAVLSLGDTYTYKNKTMNLKQNGSSLTGDVIVAGYVPASEDPDQVPVTVVESVDTEGIVKLREIIIYTLDPCINCSIDKAGGPESSNRLVLAVVKGQAIHTGMDPEPLTALPCLQSSLSHWIESKK